MSIYYVDIASGNDANAGTTGAAPLLTINAAIAKAAGPHDIRVGQTAAHTTVGGGTTTFTWTQNSVTVTANADVTASIAVGDYIGKPTAGGNGNADTFYRVTSRTYSAPTTTITLTSKHQGTTGNTTNCLKAVFTTTGSAAANAVTVNVAGTTISGGWDLATETQTGRDTWFKSNNLRTTAVAGFLVNSNNVSISKMNVIDTYYPVNCATTATGLTLTNFTGVSHFRSIFANITPVGVVATDCCFQNETANEAIYFSNASTSQKTFDGCYIYNGGIGLRMGFARTGIDFTITGGTVIAGSTSGITFASGPVHIDLDDTIIRNTSNGITAPFGSQFINGHLTSNTYGVLCSTVGAVHVKNMTFNGNTSGIGFRLFGGRIEGCTFGNVTPNTYDIYLDQYSGDVDIVNCTTNGPATDFLFTETGCTTVRMSNISIDSTSATAGRVWNQPSGLNAVHPSLIAKSVNTNGGTAFPDGYYYPYFVFVKDDSDTHSSGSAFRLQFNTATSGNVVTEVPLCQTYTESGSGKEFTYWVKADSTWAGSVIPLVRLNGVLVQTETTITSLTTSWVEKTVTVDAVDITEDGRLELAFIPNANTIAARFDDVNVTTV
jgi:hypothetical protein